MRRLVWLLALFPLAAGAGGWERLDGPGIETALRSRAVQYPDGRVQDFLADGRTLMWTGQSAAGLWRVEAGQCCLLWPPETDWDCHVVDRSENGLDLRFTGPSGAVRIGRYTDLN
ncbi:hypothetical protein E7811_01140 [Aliigemmobacter aestuarii]|uniref:Uncharacterized protein n=1 Tax=Aliigemmobacter aestuarii TaxID=1445661 RepID=A0A4S3MPQ7_9RHOB|nr:hypothetical protein [Gemmobacter aestuarii]THD84389.1 hypothetical protein E7811_01140 [Gemmobacter aestuarii]